VIFKILLNFVDFNEVARGENVFHKSKKKTKTKTAAAAATTTNMNREKLKNAKKKSVCDN